VGPDDGPPVGPDDDSDAGSADGAAVDGRPVPFVLSAPSVSSVSGEGLERVKRDTRRSFRAKTAGGAPLCTRPPGDRFTGHG
jgi:hypothetical protein